MGQEAIFQPQPKASKKTRQQEEEEDDEKDSSEEEEGEEESSEEDDEEGESGSEGSVRKLLDVLKAVYLASKALDETTLSQSQPGPSQEEELSKQKMLVQYLSDSVKCSRIIDRRSVFWEEFRVSY